MAQIEKRNPKHCIHWHVINGIIPGHALKISWESDRIEGRLSNRCSVASVTNQILNRKGNCKNRKGHEEKLCRLTILKSKVISVEKWEVYLCAIQSKLEKEICSWRAKYENLEEENWPKKYFQRLKKIMPEKRKEQENWTMKINNWVSTLTGYRWFNYHN